MNSSGALWKIPTEISVSDSLCNWHDEQCSQFTNGFTDGFTNGSTDGNYFIGNSVGKNDTSSFLFLLCFNFFFHGNSLSIYRGNISVSKIPRKFTDGNIPSLFSSVFINFLVVIFQSQNLYCRIKNLLPWSFKHDHALFFETTTLRPAVFRVVFII